MASYSQLAPYGGPGRRRTITPHKLFTLAQAARIDVVLATRDVDIKLAARRIDLVISLRRIEMRVK